MKIVKVDFKKGTSIFDPINVVATFDTGEEKKLFDYFSDEISFSENELIGKTEQEAIDLFFKKDKAYLQS